MLPNQSFSADYTEDLSQFINLEMKRWVNADIVVDNLNQQNEKNSNLTDTDLKILNNKWQSELHKSIQPIIKQVTDSELSVFLKKIQEEGQGVYTEISIIDNRALTVAQSVVGDSYWYIDKPRWQKTFGEKSYSTYISDIYYSETTDKFQVEVSFMIIANEQPIGIICAGIDVEQLEDWKKRRG